MSNATSTKRLPGHLGGRPTIRTEENADLICQQIASGKSLRTICAVDGVPSIRAVLEWLEIDPEFARQYARARAAQADYLAEETLDIADEEPEYIIAEDGSRRIDPAWVSNQKNRIDARRWFAGKTEPKKYGDAAKIELSGQITHATAAVLTDRIKTVSPLLRDKAIDV